MQTVLIEDARSDEWDFLAQGSPCFSMMQSWDWGEVKRTLGWEPFRVGVEEDGSIIAGAQMMVRTLPLGIGSLAYVPCGPVGEWASPHVAGPLFEALHSIARSRRAAFLKVEPSAKHDSGVGDLFARFGFRPSSMANQPRATIVMDIDPEPETILRSMRDSTRRKIHSTERKGVTVRRGNADDLPVFYDLMKLTSARAGFALRSYEYFVAEFGTFDAKARAVLLLAELDGEVLAGHIAYRFGANAAFFHQASDTEVSKLNPNCLLVWRQIEWARACGCGTYDLWGIPDEIGEMASAGVEPPTDRTDGLWGVYRFKSGFSKNIVSYVPSQDYIYQMAPYALLTSSLLKQGALERASTWLDTRFGGSHETE